jgi:rhodanese-related sulfurtransferase
MGHDRKRFLIVALLALLTGILPLVLFWQFIGRAPTVTVIEASDLLLKGNASLVDVRNANEFNSSHLEGAVNWPYKNIIGLPSTVEAPEALQSKTLLLICNGGISSAFAAEKLNDMGIESAYNVRGGMQAWIAGAEIPGYPAVKNMIQANGKTVPLPYRESPLFEQWMAVAAGFIIKPVYLLLSLVLIVMLWRKTIRELATLRWGLIFFLAGEAFCSVNYLFYNEDSFFFEFLHSYGMAIGAALIFLALIEGLDRRVLRYSDPADKCALLSLCDGCVKYKNAPCGLRRLFLFVLLTLIALSFMPLTGTLRPVSYNTTILGTFYNYSHAAVHQVYEIRYCPWVAIAFFTIAFVVLLVDVKRGLNWSKPFLAIGIGHFAFAFLRMILLDLYISNMVWFVFWEEATELFMMCGIGLAVWIFRSMRSPT